MAESKSAKRKKRPNAAKRSRDNPGERVFDPELTAKIVKQILAGNHPHRAAMSVGIPYRTFKHWMEWAEEGREPYCQFWQEVEAADAIAECEGGSRFSMLAQHAMPDSPQALIQFMERRWPERWSRGERREIGGTLGKPLQLIVQLTGESNA